MFDWFAHAERSTELFIERLADLDASEHPGKAVEIARAQQLKAFRDALHGYTEAIDEMIDAQRQVDLGSPVSQEVTKN